MKKHLLAVLFIFILAGCCPCTWQKDIKAEEPYRFIGECELTELLDHDQRYADSAFIYVPDEGAVETFRSVSDPITIKLFYRTDCIDSVREVPRFIKTIELAANDNIKVDVVGVNVAKDEPADLLKGWNVRYVPTFIVVKDNAEMGRVIEKANDKIETDLAKLLVQ